MPNVFLKLLAINVRLYRNLNLYGAKMVEAPGNIFFMIIGFQWSLLTENGEQRRQLNH
jgi:hypothetical protein